MHLRLFKLMIFNPKLLIEFLGIIYITIYRALIVRFLRGFMLSYPKDIKNIANQIPIYKKNINVRKSKIKHNLRRLKLASGFMDIDQNPNWKKIFPSHEQYVSLHRWNWLLWSASDPNSLINHEHGFALVRSYLNEMGTLPKSAASESYTVGERISNICLFSREKSSNWNNIPEDIQIAIKQKIGFLSRRLEILPKLTGNHIINNARALMLAGHSCNEILTIRLSRELLKKYLPVLIDNKGFLREGSSHYQFLFCRWLLEIRFVCEEMGDYETLDVIKKYLPNVLKACDFFTINKKIPLLGDISPDCEPSWLSELSNSAIAQFNEDVKSKNNVDVIDKKNANWSNLFRDFKSDSSILWHKGDDNNEIWKNGNEWFRLDYQGWSAIWHVENPSGPAIASHAHDDLGSFVLYKDNEEVIIDPGRFNYERNVFSDYSKSANAHSALLVNNNSAILSKRENKLPQNFRKAHTSIDFKKLNDSCEVIIKHDGFKRVSNKIGSHIRKFIFTSKNIIIEDVIEGSGEYMIDICFQKKISSDYDIKVMTDKKVSEKIYQGSINPVFGWYFPSFGEKIVSTTKKISINCLLPTKLSFKIEKKSN